MVKVWPAVVIAPVRAGSVFAPTLKATTPSPAPEAPAVIVIQGALAVAVHEQPVVAWTWKICPVTPAAGMLALVGLMIVPAEQPSAWLTLKVWPPAAIVPVRTGALLEATLYVMFAVPAPEAPAVTVIQDALEVAVHGQLPAACTWNVWPTAPEAGTFALAGIRVV